MAAPLGQSVEVGLLAAAVTVAVALPAASGLSRPMPWLRLAILLPLAIPPSLYGLAAARHLAPGDAASAATLLAMGLSWGAWGAAGWALAWRTA